LVKISKYGPISLREREIHQTREETDQKEHSAKIGGWEYRINLYRVRGYLEKLSVNHLGPGKRQIVCPPEKKKKERSIEAI